MIDPHELPMYNEQKVPIFWMMQEPAFRAIFLQISVNQNLFLIYKEKLISKERE